tara:strand:- start:92 stop:478 length:387 start_codon:yes stop_codon:yes gene_type:complete
MMFTSEIEKLMQPPEEVLTEANIKEYNARTNDDGGYELYSYLRDEKNSVLAFDKGWVIYNIKGKTCNVVSFYRANESKHSAKRLWDAFKDLCRSKECEIVWMRTLIKPEFWDEHYGFELKGYLMECEL